MDSGIYDLVHLGITSVTAIILAWIGVMSLRTQKSQAKAALLVEIAAEKVEEVRTVLESSTSKTDTKLDEIHKQVNGAMSAQMRLTASASRRAADLSGHPDDLKIADMADEALKEHEKTNKLEK